MIFSELAAIDTLPFEDFLSTYSRLSEHVVSRLAGFVPTRLSHAQHPALWEAVKEEKVFLEPGYSCSAVDCLCQDGERSQFAVKLIQAMAVPI